jgi:hypothetical protein
VITRAEPETGARLARGSASNSFAALAQPNRFRIVEGTLRSTAVELPCIRPSGGRTRWAHFEFTRINIEPTILRKKIEDRCAVRAFASMGSVRRSVPRSMTERQTPRDYSRWLFLTQCFDGRYPRRAQRRKP